jgi:transposase-like protein
MPSKYTPKNTDYLSQPHSGKKAPPTGTDADLNLDSLAKLFVDEDAAREWLESKRWSKGRFCAHCGCLETYKLTAKPGSKSPVRPGVYKCKACRKQFTVRIGTIFEESKIPISKWLAAIHLMTSSKKGASSHQIARELDITVKSAWFLTHRIREAMKQEPLAGMMKGVVEMDETYVGGKPRHGTGDVLRTMSDGRKSHGKRMGRGTDKAPVVVLVERDGRALCKPLDRVTTDNIRQCLVENAAPEAILMTDEFRAYIRPGREFAAHHRIKHKSGQYAARLPDGMVVHTNTAESFFALVNRGHYGIFHQLSKRHLHRYCNEFSFRWEHRKVSDGHRMVAAVEGAEGKRLMYQQPAPTQ